jgi:hypothetical protein
MTEPSPRDAAGAGFMLVATIILLGGGGLGIGSLAGAPVPFMLAGVFAGVVAGFALVYARFKDL